MSATIHAEFIPRTAGGADSLPPGPPSATKAWRRALELTAPIARNPARIFPLVIEEAARKFGEAPALLSDRESLTYRALAERSNRYARWALDAGLAKGDTVCLLMPNRPEYMAIWLGITRVGGVVALLNTNLTGASLAHCMNIAAPRHIIAAAELLEPLRTALPALTGEPNIWIHGDAGDSDEFPSLDRAVDRFGGEPLRDFEQRPVGIDDRALYIYTSGTTGLPKAANVSHARLMQWTHWFAGMMETQAGDRLYNCLPMYHSVGGVVATGAVMVGGGSVVVREHFSAGKFWDDVVRWDCTLFQYIGELCRYLLNVAPRALETGHRIRMCCGNGLRPDIWNEFKNRFHIPQILEFYAATEGNVSMFNVEGKPGAIGRLRPYLTSRSSVALVRFDVETGEPARSEDGLCVRCAVNEAGEALGRLGKDGANIGSRFEGYTNADASGQKILRDVFEAGDAWYRTGDLMRRDEAGYFYFVDRIGDTFRWKGENVSTAEVAEAVCAFPGVKQASVYGVAVPGADGRAGMALLVADEPLDLKSFRAHLLQRLPDYAVPVFLRIRREMEVTGTFKPIKSAVQSQGFDPLASGDALCFHDRERRAFVRLDTELYERIQSGQVRL